MLMVEKMMCHLLISIGFKISISICLVFVRKVSSGWTFNVDLFGVPPGHISCLQALMASISVYICMDVNN